MEDEENEVAFRSETVEEGLANFLRKFENIPMPITPHVDALRASTPHSRQPRRFPDFEYQTSPVSREEVSHPEPSTLPHTRSARTEDPDSMETWITLVKRAARCRTQVVRAQGNNYCSGTRASGIRTTLSGTRAPGNTATKETRDTSQTYNFVWMNNLHTRMTGGTVERYPTEFLPPWKYLIVFTPVIKPESPDIRWNKYSPVPSVDYSI